MPNEKHIMEVDEEGLSLTLDDGSTWAIEAGDSPTVACWYETQRIVIKKGTGEGYTLQNLDTYSQETARATRQ